MLAGGYSWRLYFYVVIAFAGALFILAFIFVEESQYNRKLPVVAQLASSSPTNGTLGVKEEKGEVLGQYVEDAGVVPPRKSFLSTLKPWSKIDHDAEFFMTMVRPFTYYTIPAVFWVVSSYGKMCLSSKMHGS